MNRRWNWRKTKFLTTTILSRTECMYWNAGKPVRSDERDPSKSNAEQRWLWRKIFTNIPPNLKMGLSNSKMSVTLNFIVGRWATQSGQIVNTYMKNMITIWPTLDPLFKVSFHHVTLLMLDCVPHIMNKAKPQFLVIWLHWTSTFIELLYRSNRRRAKPLLFQESFISLATQKKTQQTNYSRTAF